jgi:hypothetical protein
MSLTTTESTTDDAIVPGITPAPPFLTPWRVIDSAEPPGFWKAVGVDPWRGTWVMQLGTDPHPATAPLTAGELVVGFRFTGFLRAGYHTFLVRFANGPVSVSPNGGQISASLFLNVDGRGTSQIAQRNSVQYLQVARYLTVGGTHTISFGGLIRSAFQGAASPYAEIISGAEFRHFPGVASLGADVQAESAAESLAEVSTGESLFTEDKLQTVEISPRETAQARLDSLLINA